MALDNMHVYGISPGQRIADRYEVMRPSRRGGMSVAFEVEDSESRERLELQHFPSGLFDSDGQAIQLAEAFEGWCKVDSPVVVRVREVIIIDGSGLVLITDLPKGQPLRKSLDENPILAPDIAVGIARELLAGLKVIHGNGLVHGDLKPNTVFVDENANELPIQMVDGGVTAGLWMAKDLGDKTALIGTPYYAPAEQFGGESPDVKSDLYNVATVLFELIAGRLPWVGHNFLEVFQAKIMPDVPSLRRAASGTELPDGLDAAVAKGIQADPERRFQSADEFLAALEGIA